MTQASPPEATPGATPGRLPAVEAVKAVDQAAPAQIPDTERKHLLRAIRHAFGGMCLTGLLWGGMVRVPILERIDLPAAFFASLWMLWAFHLFTELDLGSRFRRLSTWALRASFLVVYFLPIMHWWGGVLGSYFFAVNGAVFVFVVIALIALANLMCAEIMRVEGRDNLHAEFRLSAVLCTIMLAVIAVFLIGLVVSFVSRHHGLPFKEFSLTSPTAYTQLITFLPILLTLVSLAKTYSVIGQAASPSAVDPV